MAVAMGAGGSGWYGSGDGGAGSCRLGRARLLDAGLGTGRGSQKAGEGRR